MKRLFRLILAIITAAFIFSLFIGCQRALLRVHIEVDGDTRTLETEAETIRELLAETNITLGELDRVNPDLNFSVKPDLTVRVIRVTEETEAERRRLPYKRRTVINEALPPGEQRMAQLGIDGEEEIVTRITYENGLEASRVQVSKIILQEPVEEILIVGAKPSATSVSFEGIITFLSGRNAWIMKDNSAARRPLTTESDLDGRVFDLTEDGSKLLYSRVVSDALDAPLNELWQVDTRIVGERPISLPIQGVLQAFWSPSTLSQTLIAYTTAERVPSQPGWRANNDLWLWDVTTAISDSIELVSANTNGLYPWWGSNFSWAPNGKKFAFANASQIGVIDVISQTVTVLTEFPPFETNSTWIWVPVVSWSPDSRFIAGVVHGSGLEGERPETSPYFDLWLFAADGTLKVQVFEQVGMWSNPVWHQNGITFGQATTPLNSALSRYKLIEADWDGSNPETLFPLGEEAGVNLPEVVWQPARTEDQFLFVNRNNLFLYSFNGVSPQPLTSDNQSHLPQWAITVNRSSTLPITTSITQILTQNNTITTTLPLTP